MKKIDKVAAVITDRIVRQLEQGVVPWRKPWKGGENSWPRSIHGRKYRGVNVLMLSMQGYSSPYWITYKKAIENGGHVKPGEKGTPVVFWKFIEVEDPDSEDGRKKIGFLRYYTVFNLEQCEGIKSPEKPETETPVIDPIEHCEGIVKGMPNPPAIQFQGDRAFYRINADTVTVPERNRFENAEEYYCTLFHELAHSTGHSKRLDRKCLNDARAGFGSDPYSKEELVAEMAAAFLCGIAEIENVTLDNSAAYIGNWLKRLKSDEKLIVNAGVHAQRAADYILGVPAYQEHENHEDERG